MVMIMMAVMMLKIMEVGLVVVVMMVSGYASVFLKTMLVIYHND